MPQAKAIYGNGPSSALGNQSVPPRPMTTQMRFTPKEPQAGGDRITQAVAKIPGLSAKQRTDVRAVFVQLVKDQAK
jgi:hypothetical protein